MEDGDQCTDIVHRAGGGAGGRTAAACLFRGVSQSGMEFRGGLGRTMLCVLFQTEVLACR